MSSQPNDKNSRTRWISQPFGVFQMPRKLLRNTKLNLSTIRFYLPHGQTVDVDVAAQPAIVLGRQADNQYEVAVDFDAIGGADSGVSRTHAVIQVTAYSVFIRDYDSCNGTFLNDNELLPMRDYGLEDNDELTLGSIKMRVKFI